MVRPVPPRAPSVAQRPAAHEDAAAVTRERIRRAAPALARSAVERMEASLPFFAGLAPDQRANIGLVLQAGLRTFSAWLADPAVSGGVRGEVFAVAPRDLARSISLQQTVEMVRLVVDTVESRVDELAEPGAVHWLREAVLRYSREIAFAAAEVYAGAAESRGAWDARLEAAVVDALLRGEADGGADAAALLSRAAALGWRAGDSVAVLAGRQPDTTLGTTLDAVLEGLRHAARAAGHDLLAGVRGEELVAVLGISEDSRDDPAGAAAALTEHFAAGPVVIGPAVPNLALASRSAAAAIAGLRVCAAWPDAPRPVSSAALLPERALAGDAEGRRGLVEQVYAPLAELDLLVTTAAYLEQAGTVDGAARALFVHPNTVRYRLRRVAEATGQNALEPRGALVLRLALAFGRLDSPS